VNYNETTGSGCLYTITRSWDVTDACGNATIATQTITVEDTTDPMLVGVPGDITVACDAIPSAPTVTANDNCSTGLSVNYNEVVGTGCPYTITRTWEVTDGCGNFASTTQIITVQDNTNPVLAGVPSDITVECDAIPSAASPTATDNCDANVAISLSETTTPGACVNTYTITRTWMAMDDCGNTDIKSQIISVEDATAPILSGVPSDITVECDNVPSAPIVTATDNCSSGLTVDFNESSGSGCQYTITRTWTATDECGNSTTAVQTLTIDDTTNPMLVGVPADVTVDCGSIPDTAVVTATDNCVTGLNVSITEVISTGCPYTITRTWTVTDDCGNPSTQSQVINVIDNEAPVLSAAPVDLTVNCDSIPAPDTLTATDNCDNNVIVNYTAASAPGICADQYTITRTWTATDECGNSTTFSQNIAVIDCGPDVALLISPNPVVCEGEPIALSASLTSGYSTPYYQWQFSDDNGANWVNLIGANSSTNSFNAFLHKAGLYRVIVANSSANINNPDCNEVSDPVEIIVHSNSPVTNLIEAICDGDSITVGANTYTTSGNYSNLLTNINGCDSLVNLSLTVHPIYTEDITQLICEGESVQVGNSIYTISGDYTDTLNTINGCDSVVNLSLTVNPIYTENLTETICEGDNVQVGNSVYTTSGNYTDVLSTVNGCDSVINLNLTVNSILNEAIFETICEGDSVQVGNSVYTTGGNYTDVLSSVYGCDSIVNLTLTVFEIEEETVEVILCFGEYYESIPYEADSTLIDTLSAITGCDSIVTTNIIVNPIYADTQIVELCAGEAYEGIIFNADSLLVEYLQSVDGCDSIINTQIAVTQTFDTIVDIDLCFNGVYNGINYTENTTLYNTYTSALQCDSFVTTNIFVHEELVHNISEQICEGETYEFGDSLYSETGTYTNVYISEFGCDSIVTIELFIIDSYTSTINANICEGETYVVNGETQTTAGTYNDTLINNNGCPIILITNLAVHPVYENTVYETICEGNSYFAGGALQTESGIYSDNFPAAYGCDSIIITELTVLPVFENSVSVDIIMQVEHFKLNRESIPIAILHQICVIV
jgi:hypothetical protein